MTTKTDGTKTIAPTADRGMVRSSDGLPAGFIGISSKFALLSHLITRDLNNPRVRQSRGLFGRGFTKEDVHIYLSNPAKFEKELRRMVRYVYGMSAHFRRLIQYFVGLSDLSYIVEPYKIDPKTANIRTTNLNYRKVLNVLSSMNIKTQLPKILTVCLREDVYYG